MFDNGEMEAVDEKGEKYISPENRKILEDAINNLKQNYPDLLEEIEEEVEALGKELDDSGQPPLKNKINEEQLKLDDIKDSHNNYNAYIKEHANESLIGRHGQILIGTSEDGPQYKHYNGKGEPISDVDHNIVRQYDLQAPHMVGLSSETKDLWDEYHKLSIAIKNPENLQHYANEEERITGEGITGLNALSEELKKQLSNVYEKQETPEELAARHRRNASPKNIIRDWVTSFGAFSPSYWRGEQAPDLLDEEAIRAIASEYKGISDSLTNVLIEDARNKAEDISNFVFGIHVPDDVVEKVSDINPDIFREELRNEQGQYAVTPQKLNLLEKQIQDQLKSSPLSAGGEKLQLNYKLLDMLNIINDAQPAIKESLNSYIDSEGLRFINSQMYQMRENNDELNDIKERKRDILEQTRKYSEMIDSKKVELQQALEIDGIESSEAESLISNLGLTYMERLMQDIDLNTGLPPPNFSAPY